MTHESILEENSEENSEEISSVALLSPACLSFKDTTLYKAPVKQTPFTAPPLILQPIVMGMSVLKQVRPLSREALH